MNLSDSQKTVYTGLSPFGKNILGLAGREVGNPICTSDSSCAAHGADFYISEPLEPYVQGSEGCRGLKQIKRRCAQALSFPQCCFPSPFSSSPYSKGRERFLKGLPYLFAMFSKTSATLFLPLSCWLMLGTIQ